MNFDPCQQFTDTMGDFLSTMCETFPDDEGLRLRMRAFNDIARHNQTMQDRLCRAYHNQMSRYYEACGRKDPTPFIEGRVEILSEMGFREKYADLTDATLYDDPAVMEENIANVWEFINKLNYYATLYVTIPSRVMERVVDAANGIMQNEDPIAAINPMTMVQMSKGILSGMTTNDRDRLVEGLPLLLRTITSSSVGDQAASAGVDIAGIMGVLQHAMAGGAAGAEGNGGGGGLQSSMVAMLATLAENTTAAGGAATPGAPPTGTTTTVSTTTGAPTTAAAAPTAATRTATAATPGATDTPAQSTETRRRGAWRPPSTTGR
ncbi:hypothetical protein pqer_cds_497 [Pandoravirus quercus]|uniref:Uncharacterized protein n=2 Tax=Pandoravirus TaxID=2060084 RepID=A0A2U7U914_9VIRU|nr:hypothetical protein pqer_cds_497 [Pandoravirus quercus]AVK74919.1 hypothetical protein pqer_cds_497 [Pandoravirus quercus]QBZ81106.1 hypothetical protein pclt_cds_512 [Pandoravirus celtis]